MILEPEPGDFSLWELRPICNGIGPAKGDNWGSRTAWAASYPFLCVARRLGILALYKDAGDQHDLLYFRGGGWKDKRRADGWFLGECLQAAWEGPWWFIPVGVALCVVFWLAVALGGSGSFSFRDRPMTSPELRRALRTLVDPPPGLIRKPGPPQSPAS